MASSDQPSSEQSAPGKAIDNDGAASSATATTTTSTPVGISNKQVGMALQKHLAELMGHKKGNPDGAHAFWDTQPVPKLTDEETVDVPIGPIDSTKTVADVRPEPFPLPAPFQWVTCNIQDDQELAEIYSLLSDNYVEDDDNMFRFDYSKEFLRWALGPPGYVQEWHVGVKTDKGKLVAFISGIPVDMVVHDSQVKMSEINFLCVHKKLRSKRLAPVLIKEVTRRVNLRGIWQAVYTAGILLTKPVAQCNYFHRSLNIKKLVEARFTGLNSRTTMSMAQRLYKLPDVTQIPGLRPMEEKDVTTVLELLQQEFSKSSKLYPVFSHEEACHTLLPRENVVVSHVREQEGKVTDFISFYILPSSIIGNDKHKKIYAAYAFYLVATSVPTLELARDALIVAKNCGMDVFNALNLGNNDDYINELKFGPGDGSLRYYLYNFLCPNMEPSKVGLVML